MPELMIYILSWLDLRAVPAAALVCRDWADLVRDPLMWVRFQRGRGVVDETFLSDPSADGRLNGSGTTG